MKERRREFRTELGRSGEVGRRKVVERRMEGDLVALRKDLENDPVRHAIVVSFLFLSGAVDCSCGFY